jgi:hypothetical protein
MLDHFDDYYLGGIDDMTFTTVECWNRLVEWFRPGNKCDDDPWDLCPLTKAITRRTAHSPPCIPDVVREDLGAEVEKMEKFVHGDEEGGDFRVWYDGPRDLESDAPLNEPEEHTPSQTHIGEYAYARFGMSMAAGEFGIGNPSQLAVSAPYETHQYDDAYLGDVHVLPVSDVDGSSTRLSPPLNQEWTGMRFGWSLASFKVPTRNWSALAVGTPGYHPGGRVFVYTGSALNSLTHKLTIIPWRSPPYRSNYGKRHFGTKVFIADVDGDGKEDLLISSPWADYTDGELLPDLPSPDDNNTFTNTFVPDFQHGAIAVFTGKQLEMMTDGGSVHDEDCAYYISPPLGEGQERFGSSVTFANKTQVMIVGSPGWGKNGTVGARGRVYGIKVTPEDRSIVFQIDGPDMDEKSMPNDFGGGGLTTGITTDGDEWLAVSAHNTVSRFNTSESDC